MTACPKNPPVRDHDYLEFMRSLNCSYSGKYGPCGGEIVAAHIRMGGGAGMGMKPSDNRTIPLCHSCHSLQHQRGEMWFHGQYFQDACRLSADLYKLYLNFISQPLDLTDFNLRVFNGVIATFNLKIRGR